MNGPFTSISTFFFLSFACQVYKIRVMLGGFIAYANGIWIHVSDNVSINVYE